MKTRLLAFPLLVLGAVVLSAACSISAGFDPVICNNDGDGCTADSDCCSFLCDNTGTCVEPVGDCTVDNDPCNVDTDCCSLICADDGYCGIPGDTGGGTCSPDQAPCQVDSDCCDPNEFCDDVGLICVTCLSPTSACGQDSDCCSGSCDVDGTCN